MGIDKLKNCAVLACGCMRMASFSSMKLTEALPVTRISLVSIIKYFCCNLPWSKVKRPIAQFTLEALLLSIVGNKATNTLTAHISNTPDFKFSGQTANSIDPFPVFKISDKRGARAATSTWTVTLPFISDSGLMRLAKIPYSKLSISILRSACTSLSVGS